MNRLDYVKAAIKNDREMYEHATVDAYAWRVSGVEFQEQAADDFAMLFGERVALCFSWLFPTRDELREGYASVVNGIVAEKHATLMAVRSGSAIYWEPAEGLYMICERDLMAAHYAGGIKLTKTAKTIREAIEICDNRAGFCLPVDNPPEKLIPLP